jgi:predicted enzyme related to lactoylglutathione lyase
MIKADLPTPQPSPAWNGGEVHAPLARPRGAITFFYYRDLERAAAFYRDVIGLPARMDSDWCVLLEIAPNVQLGLVNAQAGSQRPILGPHKGAILSLEVDDLEARLARLKRLGGASLKTRIVEGCCGRTREFKIRDPEGYTVEFFTWVDPHAAFPA